MSKPGQERSFLIDGGHIRVIALVETPPLEPVRPEFIVTDLALSHVSKEVSFRGYITKMVELKREWIGKTYKEWLDG